MQPNLECTFHIKTTVANTESHNHIHIMSRVRFLHSFDTLHLQKSQ